jgi:hypothetical protein
VPKTICLTASPVPEAAALELAVAGLELAALAELELELELELEHPAVASRPAATTVAPSRVAVGRLKIFIARLVRDPSDARFSGVERTGERRVTRSGLNSAYPLNASPLATGERAGSFRVPSAGGGR